MNCSICNKEIPYGSNFCPGCGKAVTSQRYTTHDYSVYQPQMNMRTEQNTWTQQKQVVVLKKTMDLGVKYVWVMIIIILTIQFIVAAFSTSTTTLNEPNFYEKIDIMVSESVNNGIKSILSGDADFYAESDAYEYHSNPTTFVDDIISKTVKRYTRIGYLPHVFFAGFLLIALISLILKSTRPSYTKKSFAAVIIPFAITAAVSAGSFTFILGVNRGFIELDYWRYRPSYIIPTYLWIVAVIAGLLALVFGIGLYKSMEKKQYRWCKIQKMG